jgi:hypothetical protein
VRLPLPLLWVRCIGGRPAIRLLLSLLRAPPLWLARRLLGSLGLAWLVAQPRHRQPDKARALLLLLLLLLLCMLFHVCLLPAFPLIPRRPPAVWR